MKKILLLFIIPFVVGCVSWVPEEKLDIWALENEYIKAADCPALPEAIERDALEKPEIPLIVVRDGNGEYIPITQKYLMDIIIRLFGTVEKYQFLAEIYEREFLNTDGKIMPDLTLDELKSLYFERIRVINTEEPELEEEVTELSTGSEYPMTGSSVIESMTGGEIMTLEEFTMIIEAFNYFQEYGE